MEQRKKSFGYTGDEIYPLFYPWDYTDSLSLENSVAFEVFFFFASLVELAKTRKSREQIPCLLQ